MLDDVLKLLDEFGNPTSSDGLEYFLLFIKGDTSTWESSRSFQTWGTKRMVTFKKKWLTAGAMNIVYLFIFSG